MKKTLSALFLTCCLLLSASGSAAENKALTAPAEEEHLLDGKIYFFVHSLCQNCRTAYIYLQNFHSDLDIPFTDMKFKHNLDLYKECVKKFDIPNQELTLPLICMGDEYLMGWDASSPTAFESKLANFQRTKDN